MNFAGIIEMITSLFKGFDPAALINTIMGFLGGLGA